MSTKSTQQKYNQSFGFGARSRGELLIDSKKKEYSLGSQILSGIIIFVLIFGGAYWALINF